MIRPIDIRLNAAHPELKLPEAVTYTGSPSTVLIRGVPPNYGRWAITAVFVAASFPDGSTTTRAAVQSANGVWVATLPATATSGRTANGLRILADGVDENGEVVTGYILGVADFAVASLAVAPAPAPGETSWQMLYFDAAPATPRKGDTTRIDGDLKFYNGAEWLPFTDLSNYYTAEQVDEAVDPLLFAQYYPEGNVKSAAEFTSGIKYDAPDTINRTITVKPFCNTGDSENDNSSLVGRVVIPPFVDADGNPYISDDGTRFKVVGVGVISGGVPYDYNTNLTAIIAPITMITIGSGRFFDCSALTSVSLPSATSIGNEVFVDCSALTSVSFPVATSIGNDAFGYCSALTSVSLPSATSIGERTFASCTSLTSVDFGNTPRSSVPALGEDAFNDVPTSCKIIVPDDQYDAWVAADGWSSLVTQGYKFLHHSEWEYARKYELDDKLDKSGGTMTGDIRMENGILDAGDVQTRSMFDFLQPGQPVKSLDAPENSGKALTDADIQDSLSALGAALGGKLDKSGGEMTPTFTPTTIPPGKVVFGMDAEGPYIGIAYRQNVVMLRPSQIELDGRKVALVAANPTTGNLAALDTNGNPTDAGYHFEVRNGVPCIVQYT